MIILANKICNETCLKTWIVSFNGSFSIFFIFNIYLYVSHPTVDQKILVILMMEVLEENISWLS